MNLTQFNPMKCLAYVDEIQAIMKGSILSPVLVNLDLTNRCNFKCVWCSTSNEIEMPFATVSKIINELAGCGIKSILFSGGGEPTLHPDFLRILQLVQRRGLKIGLATNGTQLHKFMNRLPLVSFKYIRVSFDAGREETYIKVHQAQTGDFERVLSAAQKISLKNQCQVGMAFLATPHNYTEIPAALKWAENYDFDYFSVRPAVYSHENILDNDQLEKITDILNSLKSSSVKIYVLKTRFDSLTDRRKIQCRATPLATVITADGKLNLCCQHRGNSTYQWGNLHRNSFRELWNSQLHRILLNKVEKESCNNCACKMLHYNQIIEKVFIKDDMHLGFL